jgi:hypothetical protein
MSSPYTEVVSVGFRVKQTQVEDSLPCRSTRYQAVIRVSLVFLELTEFVTESGKNVTVEHGASVFLHQGPTRKPLVPRQHEEAVHDSSSRRG